MKFLVYTISFGLLCWGMGYFLPWYAMPIAAFICSIILKLKVGSGFLAPFLGAALYTFIYCFIIDMNNNNLLSSKIAQMIIKTDNSLVLIVLSAVLMGLITGLAGLAGSLWNYNKKASTIQSDNEVL